MDNKEILLRTAEKEIELLKENLANMEKNINEINELRTENETLKKENEEMRKQLDSILYSKSYKFAQKLKRIVKR